VTYPNSLSFWGNRLFNMVSESLDPFHWTTCYLGHPLMFRSRSSLFSSRCRGCVKKFHIGYEMTLTDVYKQVVVITLQTGFIRLS
jgi:hypothetical protein